MSANALVDELASKIRARIMSGDIPIGSQLRQAALAETFGVSRTPIREALRQLQNGGLIEVLPNRGAVVRVPVPWEVREAYEVRAELEALAATRSVSRASSDTIAELRRVNKAMLEKSTETTDAAATAQPAGNDAFHTIIYEASGNSHLARAIFEINERFPRNVSALVLADNPRHRDENFAEHERIIDALEAGDLEAARAHMRAHVLSAGEHLAQWYERRSSTVFHG
jgi:DNA-binding GntR family transcriptional regulator